MCIVYFQFYRRDWEKSCVMLIKKKKAYLKKNIINKKKRITSLNFLFSSLFCLETPLQIKYPFIDLVKYKSAVDKEV